MPLVARYLEEGLGGDPGRERPTLGYHIPGHQWPHGTLIQINDHLMRRS